MKPTAKLRFVERDCYSRNGEHFLEPFQIKILQQWWEDEKGDLENGITVYGEWRDIPLETEE